MHAICYLIVKKKETPDDNKVIYGGNSNSYFFFFNGETMVSILNYKHFSVLCENLEFIMKQVTEATLFSICVVTL